MLTELDVTPTPQLEFAMINRDRNGVTKYIREHNYDNMAKRNRAYHDRFRKELAKADKDRKKGAEYKSKAGCEGTKKNLYSHVVGLWWY